MNRRHFCKIASIATAAIGIGRLQSAASQTSTTPLPSTLGSPCRVTVIRRECHIDLQSLFLDDPESGPCPCFNSGDEFVIKASSGCPDNFCPQLWASVCAWMKHDDHCADSRKDAPAIISCPDGTRPVIVRVDRL